MSHSHVKTQPQPPHPIVWWQIVLPVCCVLMLFVIVHLISNWLHPFPSGYETATAKIVQIRKVVASTRDTARGGVILYRLEVQVRYKTDGIVMDRWLPASDPLSEDGLVLKLASRPTTCLIYWRPSHPENARCSLR